MEGMSALFGEPGRDPKLRAALRRIESASPVGDVEALHRRILAAARPKLAELGASAPRWWEWVSGWMRVAVPVGLAASLAAGLLVRGSNDITGAAASTSDLSPDSTLVLAAWSEPAAGGQLASHLIAPESNDWLLEQAVTR
jgi:hypothetical protein